MKIRRKRIRIPKKTERQKALEKDLSLKVSHPVFLNTGRSKNERRQFALEVRRINKGSTQARLDEVEANRRRMAIRAARLA